MFKLQAPSGKILLITVACVAVAVAAYTALRAPEVVRYAMPERSTWWNAPSMLAEKWGMFNDAGVDIEGVHWPTGKRALQALLEDQADIAFVAGPPVAAATYENAPLIVLARSMSSNKIVHILRHKDLTQDWLNRPIGLARHTISEFYLIAYLLKLGKLDLYRKGALQLIDRPKVERNFISLIQNSTGSVVLFEPFASLVNQGDPASRIYMEISDPPTYQVTCYIVTTPEKWRDRRPAILSALAAIRRASNEIMHDPAKAWGDVRPMIGYSDGRGQWGLSDWQSVDFRLITDKEDVRAKLKQDGDLGAAAGIFKAALNFDTVLSVIDEVDQFLARQGL